MDLQVTPLNGNAIRDILPDLAALRITVFRDWPYLYDGDRAYEERYLRHYAESEGAIVVGAYDGGTLVGAATGAPLGDHDEEFAAPLKEAGIDPEAVFYCAESVLLPDYRGKGAGHAFFDERERHARGLGFAISAFCSVVRPKDHPARPDDYRALAPFWRKRGYAPLDGTIAHYSWKDVGDEEESRKPMQVWTKSLAI